MVELHQFTEFPSNLIFCKPLNKKDISDFIFGQATFFY